MEPNSPDQEPPSFFSFHDGDSSSANAQHPRIDDFITSHIKVSPPQPAQDPPPRTAPRPQDSDQIHPLIRNRRLETPEEISAWIAERKSKYPTDANIRLKTESLLPTKRSTHAGPPRTKQAKLENPLAALAGYGTESSDDSAPETMELKPRAANNPRPFKPSSIAPDADRRKLRVCRYFAKGRCKNGDRCAFAHPESIAKRNKEQEAPAEKTAGNLLEMLLAKDIERENSRVLQCIEHIVKNKFFGVEPKYELLFHNK